MKKMKKKKKGNLISLVLFVFVFLNTFIFFSIDKNDERDD
jgi:hypothetical protein